MATGSKRSALSRVLRSSTLALSALVLLAGCFEESLPQKDLDGQIVVPGSLVSDARDIGMVYLGIYEGFDPEQLGYPYPQTAPRVGDNPIGDALPYGGTSVGQYAYGCYRALLVRSSLAATRPSRSSLRPTP